jgi:hypothetical protein
MERAFMNEALLVCLSLGSLVAAQRYLDEGTPAQSSEGGVRRGLALAALFAATALIGAIKLPYLIILAPVFGLFIERYGRGAFTRPEPWAVSLFAIGAAALWYLHAHSLGRQTGLSFGTFDKIFDAGLVLSERFYRMVGQRTFRDILGPFGLLGIVGGAAFAWRHRRWCEGLGLLAFLAYVFVVARGNLSHDYYQLAMMPVAATLVALGLLSVIDAVPAFRRSYGTSVTTLLILVALATTIRSASFHSWYTVPRDEQSVCDLVPALFSSPTERLVVVGTSDPRFLFCLNRKGWLLGDDQTSGEALRLAWEEGARVVLVYPEHAAAVLPFLKDQATEIDVAGPVRAFQRTGR